MLTLSSVQRKSAVSVIALLMAILCFSSLLSALIEKTPLAYMDQRATTYVETTMARAAYTFAIVRGLNGMISVIQGTEIAVSPAGIGLNLSVGEVLDPINDLAERFSWIMLASTASLGVQRILMEMGDWLGLRVLLTMAMVLLAISPWKRFWVGLGSTVVSDTPGPAGTDRTPFHSRPCRGERSRLRPFSGPSLSRSHRKP